MRKITKFPKLVIDEAKNLKKFATPEELNKLNINKLISTSSTHCIYGLMTESCYSERATSLIKQCAKRVYHYESGISPGKCKRLNGTPKKFEITDRWGPTPFWSPIEVFIDRGSDEMNAKLIAFLKGERKRLV